MRRHAVITGAGRGIGRATADRLAGLGYGVVLCARSADELAETAGWLRSRHSVDVDERPLDVSDRAAVARLADQLDAGGAEVEVVVNNAGVLGPVGAIVDVDPGPWFRTFEINVGGTAAMTAAFAPMIAAAGGGSIVNLAGGGVGGPSMAERVSAYTASKAAIVSLTEAVAAELAPTVRVNAIAPGAIATSINDPVLAAGRAVAGDALYSTTLRQREQPDPVERFLDLLEWLVGPRGSWVTGRLLSARWETPDRLEAGRAEVAASGDLFRLRRIDDELFAGVTRQEEALP